MVSKKLEPTCLDAFKYKDFWVVCTIDYEKNENLELVFELCSVQEKLYWKCQT